MIYGKSHAFVFEQGKLAGVRISHNIIDWKLANSLVDVTPFDGIKWRFTNGMANGMTLKEVKKILGSKLSTDRYQRHYTTERSRIELEFSRSAEADKDDDESYKLYGVFVRTK
jgi:hypothetical protein